MSNANSTRALARNGSQMSSQPNSVRNNEDRVKMLVDKVRLMQRPIDKKCYSGKGAMIYVKEYQIKKVELFKKLLKRDEKT